MDANMFPRPEIAAALKDLVLVELFTDGTDQASEENQKLQDEKFATVAIPYYAIVDADGKVVATFPGLTKKTEEFLAFLKTGSPAGSPSSAEALPGRTDTAPLLSAESPAAPGKSPEK